MILFLNKLAAHIIQGRYKALACNSRNAHTGHNDAWHLVKGGFTVWSTEDSPSPATMRGARQFQVPRKWDFQTPERS